MSEWIGPILSGYLGERQRIEEANRREGELAAAREQRVFETLLQSNDPEIQTAAVMGLMEGAGPRKSAPGVWNKWFGKQAASPHFSRIKELISTPVLQQAAQAAQPPGAVVRPGTPGGMGTAPLSPPPSADPNLVHEQGGAPPPPPPGMFAGLPTVEETPGRAAQPAVYGPRQVFNTPEQEAEAVAIARSRGDVLGQIGGMAIGLGSEPEARQLYADSLRRRAAGAAPFQSIPGELADGTPAFGVFDRIRGGYLDAETGQPLQGFRPRPTGAAAAVPRLRPVRVQLPDGRVVDAGYDNIANEIREVGTNQVLAGARVVGSPIDYGDLAERGAQELFGRRFSDLTDPAQRQRVSQWMQTQTGDLAYSRGQGAGRASIETDLARPIGPTAAQLYNVDPTTPLSALAGRVGLDNVQKQRVYSLGQLDVMLAEIETTLPQVYPAVEPGVMGGLKTAWTLGMKTLARDADLARLDAAISLSINQIARMSGEVGNLSKPDLDQARAALATLTPDLFGGDTLQTAQARLGVVKQLIDKAKASVPQQGQAGPPPGPTARPATPVQARGAGVRYVIDSQGQIVAIAPDGTRTVVQQK